MEICIFIDLHGLLSLKFLCNFRALETSPYPLTRNLDNSPLHTHTHIALHTHWQYNSRRLSEDVQCVVSCPTAVTNSLPRPARLILTHAFLLRLCLSTDFLQHHGVFTQVRYITISFLVDQKPSWQSQGRQSQPPLNSVSDLHYDFL